MAGKTNPLAIVALVLVIVVPIGGMICGPIALRQIKRTGESGRGLAIAGIVIGIILILPSCSTLSHSGSTAAAAPPQAGFESTQQPELRHDAEIDPKLHRLTILKARGNTDAAFTIGVGTPGILILLRP